MIDKIKQLLGFGPSVDFGQLVKQGAQIIDVRTTGEFKSIRTSRSSPAVRAVCGAHRRSQFSNLMDFQKSIMEVVGRT